MILKKEISIGDLVQILGVVGAVVTIFWRVSALEKNDTRQDHTLVDHARSMQSLSENLVRLDTITIERSKRNL